MKKTNRRNRAPSKRIYTLLFTLFITLLLSGRLKVKHVDCYTQYGYCQPDLVNSLTWLKDYAILRPLPSRQVKEKLSQFPEISEINLYRRLPFTVVVSINMRKPIGAIGTSVLGTAVMVDDAGNVYPAPDKDNSAYPRLITPQPPAINTVLNQDTLQAVRSLSLLSNLFSEPITGYLKEDYLIASASSQLEILLNTDESPDIWYTSLQAILTRSKIKAKMPTKIDLRFNSSVLSY